MQLVALLGAPTGRTADVVKTAVERLAARAIPCAVAVVAEAPSPAALAAYDLVLFFTPTHGDEELQDAMEAYLVRLEARDLPYAVCELGNYYGYEEPEFGAARIVRRRLASLGWRERFPALSLDALPAVDWPALNAWVDALGSALGGASPP